MDIYIVHCYFWLLLAIEAREERHVPALLAHSVRPPACDITHSTIISTGYICCGYIIWTTMQEWNLLESGRTLD